MADRYQGWETARAKVVLGRPLLRRLPLCRSPSPEPLCPELAQEPEMAADSVEATVSAVELELVDLELVERVAVALQLEQVACWARMVWPAVLWVAASRAAAWVVPAAAVPAAAAAVWGQSVAAA